MGRRMTPDLKRLVEAVAATISSHAEELTALDSAIGDADHGLNMKRGFDAVLADLPNIAAKPLPDALKAIGKALPADPSLPDIAKGLKSAVDAVKRRGKADFGNKTMLDVLGPVAELL